MQVNSLLVSILFSLVLLPLCFGSLLFFCREERVGLCRGQCKKAVVPVPIISLNGRGPAGGRPPFLFARRFALFKKKGCAFYRPNPSARSLGGGRMAMEEGRSIWRQI